jgi:hypothetical protein
MKRPVYSFTSRFCSILFITYTLFRSGPGSSVGIVTGYGLDGPGIESLPLPYFN